MQDSWSPGRDLKQGPLEQKEGVLLTQPALYRCPVINIYINDSDTFSVLYCHIIAYLNCQQARQILTWFTPVVFTA
jgi:hypothetical protein